MASGRPMIGEIELQLVQKIETDEDQVLVQHSVPALEGDFLQRLGRRASRIKLSGVMTGPESAESLKTLRAKFRDGEPASFVADIATATQVGDVLIEEFGVRELAGKAERFAYELTLRELIAPPAPQTEPPPPVPPDPVPPDVAELEVEVIVEGQGDFDYSKVTVTVAGTSESSDDAADGAATVTAGTTVNRTLTNRTGNIWLDDQMPPGQFTATAVTDDPQMTGSAGVVLGRGERKRVTITLRPGAVVAKAFIVHFWFDKSFVEPCMREVLQQVARYAQAHSNEKLAIIGHADKQGGFPPAAGALDYNQSLSERRARSVYSYLTAGRDRQASLDEWNALRVKRPVGELPSVKDSWGTREYQYILQDLGYYSGNITEIHLPGDQTDTAVRAFQNDNGLTADGIVGDATWAALIDKYIGQDNLAVPESQFFPNARDGCDAGILKWIGASEHDSVRNTQDAWRPNRRVEMLFIAANQITCKVPKPVTFHLPPPNGAGSAWCLDNGSTTSSDFGKPPCFTTRDESSATAEKWLIQPAEPGDVIVSGKITFEDGAPLANTKYVLIAPDGKFMNGEVGNGADRGRPKKGRTGADGSFRYKTPSPVGIYTMEVELPPGPHAAFAEDEPPASARGSVVCKRLDANNQVFNVKVHRGPASDLTVSPQILLASPVVVVKKTYTNPARQLVTFRTDGPFVGTGTFGRSSDVIRFFDAAVGGNEITFNGTDNVFDGAQLTAGVQLFAEGATASAAPDDVQLMLTLGTPPIGLPATATMTSVELILDVALSRVTAGVDPPAMPQPPAVAPVPGTGTDKVNLGRSLIVQDAAFTHERAMLIIRPPQPAAFAGTLELTVAGGHAQAFSDEIPAAGQVPIVPPSHTVLTSAIPAGGVRVFAQGATASGALRDTEFRLGIQGLEPAADLVKVTVFPDPSLPGPFAVGEHEYPAGLTFAVPTTTETFSEQSQIDVGAPTATVTFGGFPATLRALVRYPAQVAGVDQPIATMLPSYPLVIIAHGNHGIVDAAGNTVESFRGLEYLARHLASYGYIAVSIDLNDMNRPIDRFPAIVQRGLTILDHIRQWGVFNTTDPIFTGHVDLGQVALIGHSRGGEAVVSAQRLNIDNGSGHNIRAVISISPTDFLGITLPPVPYLVIYGSEDGDVSIGWPFRLYDRADALKAMVFVYGAIHNRFSTDPDWLALIDSTDARRLSEADHLNLARGYCLGFLDMVMHNVGDHAQLFKKNGRPSTIGAAVELHHQVQDPTRLTVDNFDQGALNRAAPLPPQLAARAGTNTLGGVVTVAGLVAPTGMVNARTEASLQHRDIAPFWHDTVGGMVAWDAAGGTYTTEVGDRDVSAFAVLSFRVAQRFDSPRNPNPAGLTTPGATQDCTVTLVDAANETASIRAGTIALIPFPYKRTNAALTKSALKTIRIPLGAFTTANANLSLAAIRFIRFELGPAATGELAIDDIEFSN